MQNGNGGNGHQNGYSARPNRRKSLPQTEKQKCFLVCNAHIDPVWLWPWEEGLTEAISTFRVAADFCDSYPDFVFNHNESLLYEWVERNDPTLFRRIQRLVKSGQWHIAGGSYLQPDMIASSGESMIRQFLVGKLYFQEKFGVEPTTAYNFDSFGHPQGMIQILAGCGIDSYIFCRPNRNTLPLPVGSFRWRHASGAEVIARRSDDHYLTQGEIGTIWRDGAWPEFHKAEGDFMFLWGIGNHGGGPSRKEYAQLRKLSTQFPNVEFIESTPEAFFQHTLKVRGRKTLSAFQGDFGPVSEGCYTSMQQVKTRHRQMENLMHLTEKLAAMAWWKKVHPYPEADLKVAWKDILFAEFHDILPGSGIQKVEQDSLNLLGHAEEILRRKKAEILISLLREEKLSDRNITPIFIFNPHAWEVTQEVEIEYGTERQTCTDGLERQLARNGKIVDTQFEKAEENLLNPHWGEWRRRAVFLVKIPPFSHQRFDASYRLLAPEKIVRWQTPALPKDGWFESGEGIRVKLNLRTGLIDRIEENGHPVVNAPSFRPLVSADLNHSWATIPEWRAPVGLFRLATPREAARIIGSEHVNPGLQGKKPISIIEDGPVRVKIEAIFVHDHSYIVQHYIINKHRPVFRIEQTIFWAEHDRMLRLEMAHDPALRRVEVEKCYSIDAEMGDEGREHDFQHFLRFSNDSGKGAFAIVSHGSHGYSRRGNHLRLSILRSPGYGAHEQNIPRDCDRFLNRYILRHDQGIRTARFTLLFGAKATSTEATTRAAWEENVPLEAFVYFPTCRRPHSPASRSFLAVSAPNVLVSALKKAESGDALVIRLWETGGKKTRFQLSLDGTSFSIEIGPWQLRTYRLRRNGHLIETDLLERSGRMPKFSETVDEKIEFTRRQLEIQPSERPKLNIQAAN